MMVIRDEKYVHPFKPNIPYYSSIPLFQLEQRDEPLVKNEDHWAKY